MPFDITIVITAHREGRLAHRTVRSAVRSAEFARQRGAEVEMLAVLDRPDEATEGYFASRRALFSNVHLIQAGDAGVSRNTGIRHAQGRFICFLDADDLFSENWVWEAFGAAREFGGAGAVVHPEYNLFFGRELACMRHRPSTDARFSPFDLIQFNYWTALGFAAKDLFERAPYCLTSLGRGFGYEDWHWNCEALAVGAQHIVAPGTAHFIRRKTAGSLLTRTNHVGAVIRASRLFDVAETATEPASGPETSNQGGTASKKPRRSFSLYSWLRRRLGGRWRKLAKSALPVLARYTQPALPGWLLAEWRAMDEIEPGIFATKKQRAWMVRESAPESVAGRAYPAVGRAVADEPSHLLLISPQAAAEWSTCVRPFVQAACEAADAQVVCIATDCRLPTPAIDLPRQATLVELAKYAGTLTPAEQEILLTRLLLQKRPKTIHVIGSRLGFEVLSRRGGALSTFSRLYVSVQGDERRNDGQPAGLGVEYLHRCVDYLTHIFANDPHHAERQIRQLALDESQISAVPLPTGEQLMEGPRLAEFLQRLSAMGYLGHEARTPDDRAG